jgi:hypothetical protein
MTWHFSYIGDLDDPKFAWDNPDDWAYRTGNLPRRVVPPEPGESLGVDVSGVIRLTEAGPYEGKQIDWSAWGLKMTGAQLRAFLSGNTYADAIAALDPDRVYVLVVAEGV